MEQNTRRIVELIFSELHEQGRSQRWLARRLRERLGEDSAVWEPRLSEWKAGRRLMPQDAIDESCRLLGISDSVRFFVAQPLLDSSETLRERVA